MAREHFYKFRNQSEAAINEQSSSEVEVLDHFSVCREFRHVGMHVSSYIKAKNWQGEAKVGEKAN
jgi:hypothetical protein